ncbi:uncharacterized protein LOC110239470 [Exaiptasia diaphana]|uniref:Uncharacterized protein n=1 Tax=Exaiptasia diaphana TaxID=2652724 RepID=A0A913X942_EXADI|nr:uncharacterized protein LOC110239470 [Exaiptasia diaphana]KXJ13992.1 hypothetical protein AC249_AIPGENE7754 [Exaiptasia diaphana]
MSQETPLEGYIHVVSPIKIASNKEKTKYFDCKMQTSDDKTERLVCYSPQKRLEIHEACENKSPIKISSTKRKLNKFNLAEDKEIVKSAKITSTELDFEYNESLLNNLLSIKECQECKIYTTVDIKVKVLTKPDTKQPIMKNKETKYKTDCIVADLTASIKLVLWEECIDKVRVGKSYHMQHLTVRIFEDVKFINTNESTIISEIPDIGSIDLMSMELNDSVVRGQCISAGVEKSHACIACNSTITDEEGKGQDSVTCQGCKMTLLKSFLKTKIVCQVIVHSRGKNTSYTCFTDAIDSFLAHRNLPDSDKLTTKEIEDLMVHGGEQDMVVDECQKIIYQFL